MAVHECIETLITSPEVEHWKKPILECTHMGQKAAEHTIRELIQENPDYILNGKDLSDMCECMDMLLKSVHIHAAIMHA